MNDADACSAYFGRVPEGKGLTVPEHFPGICGIDAGQNFDEGGFAGAVFSYESVDFPCVEGKVDIFQGVSATLDRCRV